MMRKMEKVELEMSKWNKGVKKLDPVQQQYSNLITSVKQLCENDKILDILLQTTAKEVLLKETAPMVLLREATNEFTKKKEASNDHEVQFLRAKVEHIKRALAEELKNPAMILCKGKVAQMVLDRTVEAMNF